MIADRTGREISSDEQSKPRRHWSIGGCVILYCFGFVNLLLTLYFPERLRSYTSNGDGIAFSIAARAYVSHQDMYITDPQNPIRPGEDLFPRLTRFLYPPTAVWLLMPVFYWGGEITRILWIVVTIMCFGMVAYSLTAIPISGETPVAERLLMVITLTLWYPFVHHLGVAQVDVLVLALCLFTSLNYSRRPTLAALALTTATALKLYPALLLPFLIWGRQSARRFASCYLLLLGGAILLTLLVFTHSDLLHFVQVLKYKNDVVPSYIVNQSLLATVNRLSGPGGSAYPSFPRLPMCLASYERIRTLLGVLPIALALVMAYRHRRHLTGLDQYCLSILGYALAAPIFWVQSYVLILPVYFACLKRLSVNRLSVASGAATGLICAALVIQYTVWFNPAEIGEASILAWLLYHRYIISLVFVAVAYVVLFTRAPHLPIVSGAQESGLVAQTTQGADPSA